LRGTGADPVPCPALDEVPPATAPRSLRIVLVTETYPPEINGVAGTVKRMVDDLHRRGHELWLVRPRQGRHDRDIERERLHERLVAGCPIPMYREMQFGWPADRMLRRLLAETRADVLHVATEGPLGWSALNVAQRANVPVSSDFRTNFHLYTRHYRLGALKSLALRYLRAFHRRTDVTTVPTRRLGSELAALGFGRLAVIRRGVDTELFTPQHRDAALRHSWGASEQAPVVIYVGRIAAEKNIELLFEAFEAIRSRQPAARLVLVGDGPERTRLARRYPHALFAGPLRGVALARCYASADLFLFPSLTETFGNVTMEALASGLAVVAFDYAAAGEHITDGATGRVVAFGDAAAFVSAAEGLASQPQLIQSMGRRARDAVAQESWDAVLAPFERLLHELALRPAGPPRSALW